KVGLLEIDRAIDLAVGEVLLYRVATFSGIAIDGKALVETWRSKDARDKQALLRIFAANCSVHGGPGTSAADRMFQEVHDKLCAVWPMFPEELANETRDLGTIARRIADAVAGIARD